MKRPLHVALLVGMVAGISVAVAQTPAPPPASATPPVLEQAPRKPATVRPNASAKANADARLCLELATNVQIIACAEKYR